MSQAVKRACDACHRRKVKCDGTNPCRNCGTAQLGCTYNAVPQKKGPKGSRAKVISELRENQRQTSLAVRVHNRISGLEPPPSEAATPGLLTGEIVRSCLDFFFTHLSHRLPFLNREQIDQQIPNMEKNRDVYCLLSSLCAFTALQPGMAMPGIQDDPQHSMSYNMVASMLLLEDTLRVRKNYELLDHITFNALATNFFILACYHSHEAHDKAWFYLREAITMIHLISMDKEEQYRGLDAGEASRRRRLYWLFYVHERAHAIQRHRHMSLQASVTPPALGDDPSDNYCRSPDGFIMLTELYRPVDDSFIAQWNKARMNISAPIITSLHTQLHTQLQNAIEQGLIQDSLASSLPMYKAWIEQTLWYSDSSRMNGDRDNSFHQYGANAYQGQIFDMATCFPKQGTETEPVDVDLIEKLLKMCSSVLSLLENTPRSGTRYGFNPQDHLEQLLSIIDVTRRGDYRFLPLLFSKVTEILPRLTNPMLQRAPEMPMMAELDIFDGFGNAGMAQVPQQMNICMDPVNAAGFDQKVPREEYDKQYNGTGNTPDSSGTFSSSSCLAQNADMNNAFLGSPNMMSTGMDYSQSMNNFNCTPLPDVMSPLGNSGQANPMMQMQGQHQSHMASNAFLGNVSQQNMNQGQIMYSMHQSHMHQAQQPQNSFQLQRQTSTGGNFHNMHDGFQDMHATGLNAGSLGVMDMDFSTLR